MLVCKGHQVGCDGRFVCLLETRDGEGTWDEFSRCRIRRFEWLMRVKGTAVVSRRSELVPVDGV